MEYKKKNLETLSEWYENHREPELTFTYNHPSGYTFFIVVDSTAIPAYFDSSKNFGKGGTRYSSQLTLDKMKSLAKTMTKKNALPGSDGLYGGAKSGIKPPEDKEKIPENIIGEFAKASWMVHVENDGLWGGPGCDINFQEESIKKYIDFLLDNNITGDIRVATGRPSGDKYKGAAYDENGAAGRGVVKAMETSLEIIKENPSYFPKIPIKEKYDIALQGLGAMGGAIAKRIEETPHRIIAVSEASFGKTIINKKGLEIDKILKAHSLKDSGIVKGKKKDPDDIIDVNCDILIPAAIGGVVDKNNYKRVRAPFILEAANSPVKREAKEKLYENNTLVLPGESTNFGGSVAASVELNPKIENNIVEKSLEKTDKFVKEHVRELMKIFVSGGGFDGFLSPHYITDGIALERIVRAMIKRKDRLPENIKNIVQEKKARS